ncbi:MAG: ATP-binding cassette domain-containing protein, partial [Bdellovibrionales bacterium]|nr:ATP-binding cassette domain-containing protein [Bdellovibrionales bacterium]
MVPRSEELVRENILEQRWITLESDLKKAYAETDEVRKKEATSNIVEVSNLKKFYPIRAGFLGKTVDYIRAVNEVSFSIPKGEILGLVGESGCGKSTLGRCLLGLEKSDSGSIRVGGHELAQNESLVRRMAQIVFQDPFSSLNPRMR